MSAICLSVSLISTNEKHFLERLLPSLSVALQGITHEILLVDNQCSDSTAEFIQQSYPMIRVFRNNVRATYGANHNQNIAAARGKYILVMNSDMTVSPDALSEMLQFMEGHPDVGILCPRVFNEDGSDQYLNKRNPTVADLFLRGLAPAFLRSLFQNRLDSYEMRDVGYDRISDVENLTGAFMFCRADILKRVGGFDPDYLLYFEDFDLCRKVQATHRTVYLPKAKVIHYWQRAPHKSIRSATLAMRSAFRYYRRWGLRLY